MSRVARRLPLLGEQFALLLVLVAFDFDANHPTHVKKDYDYPFSLAVLRSISSRKKK